MHLTDIVVGLIEDAPGSTVDDLLPDAPDYTRAQIMQAMQNAAFTKRLVCEPQGGAGMGKGTKPSRYYPADHVKAAKPTGTRYSSVWDYAARA